MDTQNKVTVKDVAKRAQVSIATVSRVINNLGNVRTDTYNQVMKAVHELGYNIKPAVSANNQLIMVITPAQFGTSFFYDLREGIYSSAKAHDFVCITYTCDDLDAECAEILEKIRALNVVGVITLTYVASAATMRSLQTAAPVVQCAVYNEELDCSYFSWDYYGDTRAGIEYILSRGKRNIALFNGSQTGTFLRQFERGYSDALTEAGVKPNPQLMFNLPHNSIESQYSVAFSIAAQLLNRSEIPDAIFCTDEVYASAVVAAINQKRLSMPNDIGVMGFGGTFISIMSTPKITSINQTYFELGYAALEHLIERVLFPTTPKSCSLIHSELVIRETI